MESKIARALGMRFQPVALLWSDEKPSGARQFSPGKWGCVMWLFAAAARGEVAACDRETFGCLGGGTGLGFGNQYLNWPGGIENFYCFLSTGRPNRDASKGELRREAARQMLEEERYLRSPEVARHFVQQLPMTDIPARYVVFKPLGMVEERERPVVVIFTANPDQLAALTVLANFGRAAGDNVLIPFAAGCQAIGILPYREAQAEQPRAVVGLVDLSARRNVAKLLGREVFTFAVPFKLFRVMEEWVEESFLAKEEWQEYFQSSPDG
ncbi:DUF169 domain-containing protein [Ammonifex thiophilus]|uniref:DUF169 domain-containing protein n=1 Tax=Ammonifex thiophilus TaxID=444093 RepID=A0A3D8P5D4_9THEO|nr:DUF169 domain-containing protein [Ammonifex thiophilus]RDV84550.1 hypothetical protein DXX99_00390 [Ammonifex thiophilus]